VLGAILGIVFAASSVYLALKIGLTVSASIPIAVLSVAFFRTLGRSTILENNIVQTTGSAGESIAAGIVFTLPAILLMGYDLSVGKVAVIAVVGGVMGILMMIPLRRALSVKGHGRLTYPEGTPVPRCWWPARRADSRRAGCSRRSGWRSATSS